MIQVRAQAGGGPLHAIPPTVPDNIDEQVDMALRGQMGSRPSVCSASSTGATGDGD